MYSHENLHKTLKVTGLDSVTPVAEQVKLIPLLLRVAEVNKYILVEPEGENGVTWGLPATELPSISNLGVLSTLPLSHVIVKFCPTITVA